MPALGVIDKEIFERTDFTTAKVTDDALNRHLVAHGRTAGYGTPINGVRTLTLLLALVELFDGPVVLRASSSPVDEGALLDEYGRWLKFGPLLWRGHTARSPPANELGGCRIARGQPTSACT